MSYNPRIASVAEHEYAELMAIVREEAAPRPVSDDDRWRTEYAEEQRRRRVIGHQQDLFTSTAITHYRRGRAAPSVNRPPVESVAAKLERIKGDPLATFGAPRSDRPTVLSAHQRKRMFNSASNWLNVRQPVRLVDAPGSVDPQFGIQRYLGRRGVIWRLCGSPFEDHCYVFFDAVGAERTAKIHIVEVRDLEPVS